MKFELDSKVMYKGQEAIIYDYNERYKDYIIILNGKRIYNVKEEDLEAL